MHRDAAPLSRSECHQVKQTPNHAHQDRPTPSGIPGEVCRVLPFYRFCHISDKIRTLSNMHASSQLQHMRGPTSCRHQDVQHVVSRSCGFQPESRVRAARSGSNGYGTSLGQQQQPSALSPGSKAQNLQPAVLTMDSLRAVSQDNPQVRVVIGLSMRVLPSCIQQHPVADYRQEGMSLVNDLPVPLLLSHG